MCMTEDKVANGFTGLDPELSCMATGYLGQTRNPFHVYDPAPLRLTSPSNLALKMSSSSDSPPSYRTSLNDLLRRFVALEGGL